MIQECQEITPDGPIEVRGPVDEMAHGVAAIAHPNVVPALDVLCLPAHGEADEIAGMMLAQILEADNFEVRVVPAAVQGRELMQLVGQRRPAIICVSAAPPAGMAHARYLCRRLRQQLPEITFIVGLWSAPGQIKKAVERIGSPATTLIIATLAEAQGAVHSRTAALRVAQIGVTR
jgi:hypothetical protein